MPDVPVDDPLSNLDTSVAHSARVYDYWLGGKDNFAADREAGDQVIAIRPAIRSDVRENRAFLRRAVRFLAAEVGIRQFLDIGTGLPVSRQHARGRAGGRAGSPGSCTSTTTRWCSRTPARC